MSDGDRRSARTGPRGSHGALPTDSQPCWTPCWTRDRRGTIAHDHRLPRPLHHRARAACRRSATRRSPRFEGPAPTPPGATRRSPTTRSARASRTTSCKLQRERGTDLTIFSPRASAMAHHVGDEAISLALDAALQRPDQARGRAVSRRTSSASASCRSRRACRPRTRSPSCERCVNELGFVGCNLNPDPSGGHWTGPPLTDRSWYPLYEKMVELDVPAMVHV